MCNIRNSDLSLTTVQLNNDELQVVFGASVKALLSFCDYKEEVSVHEYSEIILPAKTSREITVGLDWKILGLRFLYDVNVPIQYQRIGIKENKWLVNPITNEVTPNFQLSEINYSSFLPTAIINFQDIGENSDIISISDIKLEAGVDFAIGASATDTANNIIAAIAAHEILSLYVSGSLSGLNLTITGLKPLHSYQTIKVEYIPSNASLNNVPGTGFLTSNVAIDDSFEFVHEMLIKSVPQNNLTNSYTLYNFMETDVRVKILKSKY